MFPDVKALVIKYLNQELETEVYSRVPKMRPSSFMRVLLAGGTGQINPALEEVAVTLESWDDDEHQAFVHAEQARAALRGIRLVGDNPVYRYREWGPPVDLPDESGQWRYTFTFSIRLRIQTA